MKKTSQTITAVLFFLFLAGFGALHLFLPDRDFSSVENRTLAQRPAFSWKALKEGAYTSALETYLADQFPLRDGWMGVKAGYSYLLGRREFNNVYLCGDTLISKVPMENRGEQNLGYIQKLTEKSEVPVYLALVPTAAETWKDKLPQGAESFDQTAFLELAKETGAHWVDMAGALQEHAREAVYYRTDHHWTSLGAYYGYEAVTKAMGLPTAELGGGEQVSGNFYGTLYSSSGVHWLRPDTIERYVSGEGVTVENGATGETGGLYVDHFLREKDQYASFLGGNNPLYIVRNPDAATGRTLLVVRDSYSDSLAPFLSQTFATVYLMDLRYYRQPVARYAGEIGADAILVCYNVGTFVEDVDVVFLGV